MWAPKNTCYSIHVEVENKTENKNTCYGIHVEAENKTENNIDWRLGEEIKQSSNRVGDRGGPLQAWL